MWEQILGQEDKSQKNIVTNQERPHKRLNLDETTTESHINTQNQQKFRRIFLNIKLTQKKTLFLIA